MNSLTNDDNPFDVKILIDLLEKSLLSDTDIDLLLYIKAFSELNKMIGLLGRIFSFVRRDVAEKERIIMELYSTNPDNYKSVEQMIQFECIINSTSNQRGCRTLLCLHRFRLATGRSCIRAFCRALEFMVTFIRRIHDSVQDDRMSDACRSAYDETLAHYHPWLIRKGVHLAVYALPERGQFLMDILGATPATFDAQKTDRILLTLINNVHEIHNRAQTLFRINDILNLS